MTLSSLFLPGFSDLTEQRVVETFFEDLAEVDDWRARLERSLSTPVGRAAPGGRFTKALYSAVLHGNLIEIAPTLAGRIVIELGAGGLPYGYMLAHLSGATAYIGVEPFYADVLLQSIQHWLTESGHIKTMIPYTVSPLDMLAALERIDAKSVSVLACGIERCIVPDPTYRTRVEAELGRIIHPAGAFVAFRTDLFPNKLHLQKFSLTRFGSTRKETGFIGREIQTSLIL